MLLLQKQLLVLSIYPKGGSDIPFEPKTFKINNKDKIKSDNPGGKTYLWIYNIRDNEVLTNIFNRKSIDSTGSVEINYIKSDSEIPDTDAKFTFKEKIIISNDDTTEEKYLRCIFNLIMIRIYLLIFI